MNKNKIPSFMIIAKTCDKCEKKDVCSKVAYVNKIFADYNEVMCKDYKKAKAKKKKGDV